MCIHMQEASAKTPQSTLRFHARCVEVALKNIEKLFQRAVLHTTAHVFSLGRHADIETGIYGHQKRGVGIWREVDTKAQRRGAKRY